MNTEKIYPDSVKKISTVLKDGGLIIYPTDTIWGLGCDATNATAVETLIKTKKKPKNQGLIILVNSIKMLKRYVVEMHPRVQTLLAYHNHPLTVIYPDGINLPDLVLGPKNTVAIRLTKDPFLIDLLHEFKKPIVSTSANLHKRKYPKTFHHIDEKLLAQVQYVVEHKRNDEGEHLPSVMASYNKKGELEFIRT